MISPHPRHGRTHKRTLAVISSSHVTWEILVCTGTARYYQSLQTYMRKHSGKYKENAKMANQQQTNHKGQVDTHLNTEQNCIKQHKMHTPQGTDNAFSKNQEKSLMPSSNQDEPRQQQEQQKSARPSDSKKSPLGVPNSRKREPQQLPCRKYGPLHCWL